jgi:hypothetical protein
LKSSTAPLEEYIEQIKRQNREGLLSKMQREQKQYIDKLLTQKKHPIRDYISQFTKKKIYSGKQSSFLDIKA